MKTHYKPINRGKVTEYLLFPFRCIRFNNKHIVSGAYDGKIKVWDLQAALDTRKPPNALCIRTLMVSEPSRHPHSQTAPSK